MTKADDGISGASKSPELVRHFFNNLEIVKGQQPLTAQEAARMSEKM